jgi:hypothetical protein
VLTLVLIAATDVWGDISTESFTKAASDGSLILMSDYLYSDKYTKLHVLTRIIVMQYFEYICKLQMPFTIESKNVGVNK